MTDANELLRLIESADPSDSVKLDEIDARVWCYTRGNKIPFAEYFKHYNDGDYQAFRLGNTSMLYTPHFTRSRDALKAVRPDGWYKHSEEYNGRHRVCLTQNASTFGQVCSPQMYVDGTLPTEELAELHAIIQAIAYERENKN